MAVAYITEYGSLAKDKLAVGQEPELKSQTVAIGTEAKSSVFLADTSVIRVHVDAICSILIGASPTAATTNRRMAANQTEYFAVRGGVDKISVITNT